MGFWGMQPRNRVSMGRRGRVGHQAGQVAGRRRVLGGLPGQGQAEDLVV